MLTHSLHKAFELFPSSNLNYFQTPLLRDFAFSTINDKCSQKGCAHSLVTSHDSLQRDVPTAGFTRGEFVRKHKDLHCAVS